MWLFYLLTCVAANDNITRRSFIREINTWFCTFRILNCDDQRFANTQMGQDRMVSHQVHKFKLVKREFCTQNFNHSMNAEIRCARYNTTHAWTDTLEPFNENVSGNWGNSSNVPVEDKSHTPGPNQTEETSGINIE